MNLNFEPNQQEQFHEEKSSALEIKSLRKKKTFLVTMNFMTKSVQVNLSYN